MPQKPSSPYSLFRLTALLTALGVAVVVSYQAQPVSVYKEIDGIRVEEFSTYYDNGNPRELFYGYETETLQLRHGPDLSWYDNGQIKIKAYSYKGRYNGQLEAYFRDGQLAWSGTFVRGKMLGVVRAWFNNGAKRSETRFTNGIANGPSIRWYKSSQLKSVAELRNNQYHGQLRAWHPDGELQCIQHYQGGERTGLWQVWDTSNTLVAEGRFERDKPVSGTFVAALEAAGQYGVVRYEKTGEMEVIRELDGDFHESLPRQYNPNAARL